MATSISDLIPIVKDYCRNQNLSNTRVISALNQSFDYVNSELGLPSQETSTSLDFDQDTPTYALPSDFIEATSLRFDDDELNRNKSFSYKPIEYLHEKIKSVTSDTRLFGVGAEDGAWKLYILCQNSVSPLTLDTFDSNNATNWTVGGGASNITNDIYVYKEGAGSLSFDITGGGTSSTLTKTNSNDNFYTFLNTGHHRVWLYLQATTHFTSISLSWGTNASNYYLQTATAQADGTAFQIGWNDIDLDWATASQVGTPDPNVVSYYQWGFNYTAAFVGGTSFRLDYSRIMVPDTMKLVYYSSYKGTTSTGTPLVTFTSITDLLSIDAFDKGLLNLYAIKAAEIINPQILNENQHAADQYSKYSLMYRRKFPRKRLNNFLCNPKVASTD